ncbi:MAG TPA: glycan-binding surface protein [Chryseosolibacter sp.]|nr:glycan-binding surface protein [Chryseosolibacter sp.]
MKTNKITSRLTMLLIYLGSIAFLISCNDNEADPPVITDVRVVSKPDTSISAIGAGSLVVIEGKNFTGVKQVLFNDFPAPFNPNYVTDHTIIVTIPEEAPTEVTDPNTPNEIRVVGEGGAAVFDFALLPPPPQIFVLNEFTKPGDEMVLYGTNIFLVEKVILPGDIEVTGFTVDEEGTTLTFTLPVNATEPGPIQLKTKYTTVTSPAINDVTGMLVNFDDIGSLEWGTAESADESAFPGGRGEFALMDFGTIPADNWSWWEWGRSINTPGSTVWLPQEKLSESLEDYALKFEMFVKKPWKHGTFMIVKGYNWTYLARFAPWRNTPQKVFETDQWVTVTIPLTMFKTKANNIDGTGEPAPSMEALLGDGKGNFNLFYVNDKTYSDGPQEGFSTGIDNVRLVKINND